MQGGIIQKKTEINFRHSVSPLPYNTTDVSSINKTDVPSLILYKMHVTTKK